MKKTKFKQNLSRTIKEIGNGSKIRGITLISLIVVIIIMLILAGVTILALNNSGLLKNAEKAEEKYEESKQEEYNILNTYSDSINDYNTNVNIDLKLDTDYNKEKINLIVNNNDKIKSISYDTYIDNTKVNANDRGEIDLSNFYIRNYNKEDNKITKEIDVNLETKAIILLENNTTVNKNITQKIQNKVVVDANSIPIMKSNEDENGKATANYSTSGYPAYHSFDDVYNEDSVTMPKIILPAYSQYEVKIPSDGIIPVAFSTFNVVDAGYGTKSTGYFSASEDGVNFDTLCSFENLEAGKFHYFYIEKCAKKYKFFRCTLTKYNNSYAGGSCRIKFNVYGCE